MRTSPVAMGGDMVFFLVVKVLQRKPNLKCLSGQIQSTEHRISLLQLH